MPSLKKTETNWYPDKKLIVTHISGDINSADVEIWERSLHSALEQIEDNGTFKIFVNLYGFTAVDIDAHKRFRGIIPLTLAEYGWKVGYVDLFEDEAKAMAYSTKRGVSCTAAAHCHQDATKIEKYERYYSRDNEHYFTNPESAMDWIENV